MDESETGRTRYGVFLRPDPKTCLAVSTITAQVRAQYGFVSAGVFPPHATLVGSLPLAQPVSTLVAALEEVLSPLRSFPVANAGVSRMNRVIVYDLHVLDGRANAPLLDLAARVDAAVRPLLAVPPAGTLAADVTDPDRWHAHLSLASHDLYDRPDLTHEVFDYIRGLELPNPPSFPAEVVSAYRFDHPTWTGDWWHQLRWSHVRSWRLPPG